MTNFVEGKYSYISTAINKSNKRLYEFHVVKARREIRSLRVIDQHNSVFELPPFSETQSDSQIATDLIPFLGKKLNIHQRRLLDKYLSGSIHVLNGCFGSLKKATLVLPSDLSVVLSGLRCDKWFIGAFKGDADITLKLPENMGIFKVQKFYNTQSFGKDVPVMEAQYTLVADKSLEKISSFDSSGLRPYGAITNTYFIEKSNDYKVEYLDEDELIH